MTFDKIKHLAWKGNVKIYRKCLGKEIWIQYKKGVGWVNRWNQIISLVLTINWPADLTYSTEGDDWAVLN